MTALHAAVFALVLMNRESTVAVAQAAASGVVSSTVAEFAIPVGDPGVGAWRWKRAETRDDGLEYRWGVRVTTGGQEYEFGFSLFKFPGAAEGSGSLEDLLRAGQASLWKLAPGRSGGTVVKTVKSAKVLVSAKDETVLIQITDAALVQLLFGEHPATARVVAKTPETTEAEVVVPVQYQ